jgi:phenylacetate-CoA ligase
MNSFFSKYFFFYPVRFLQSQPIARCLRYVHEFEQLDVKSMQEAQWKKLKSLLDFSYQNIPYYHSLFTNQGLHPSEIRTLADFSSIPFLTKNIVQKNPGAFRNPRKRFIHKRSTSGSTGVPLCFHKDNIGTAILDAVQYHSYGWHGIEIGAPQARFWGTPPSLRNRMITRVKDILMNRTRLSAFDLSSSNMERYYRKIMEIKPKYFYGYPSIMHEFALFMEKSNFSFNQLDIKAVIGTAEMPIPAQIARMTRIFNAPFVNEYGCTEVGVIALTCPSDAMHVMSSNIYVETIKDGSPAHNVEGEIVVTELNTESFPFIRYCVGDRGILSNDPCKCGLNLPVMKSILGREADVIKTRSGGILSDAIFEYIFKTGIDAYRAIQTKIDHIEIWIVTNTDFTTQHHNLFLKELRSHTQGEIEFTLHLVDVLPRDPSGKLRLFVSRISKEQLSDS